MKMKNLWVVGVVLIANAEAQAPQAYEVPPVFEAGSVVPAELMRGPHHRVRAMAPSDGYLTHFTIDSDYGVFECAGRRQLRQRVREIGAIAELVAVSKSDLFAEGLKRSVDAPIDAVKNIAQDPVGAAKQVPKTVGHFFSKVGSSISGAAKKVERKIQESKENDVDSGEALAGAGHGLGQAAKSVAGFDMARLNTARELGVDPYSDNPRLQSEIEKVTWAFFAGGLPLRIGAAAVSAGASTALAATKVVGLPEEIYDVTPGELALRDREALTAMGVAPALLEEVFLNEALSVSLRHGIVRSLQMLPAGPGRVGIIGVAAGVEHQRQAAFLNWALRRLVARHQLSPYAEVKVFGRAPAGLTADGTCEVAAPVDQVSWTEQTALFAQRSDLPGERRRLLLGGSLSPSATSGFSESGWSVVPIAMDWGR